MRRSEVLLFTTVVCATLAVLPAAALSDVRVYLKNGSSMTAEACDEAGGTLTCYKMGGTFQLDRKDVERIKTIPAEERPQETAPASAAPQEKGPGAKEETGSAEKKDAALTPQQQFDQIRQRKMELQKDREKLVKDREQLQQDMKKAPDWMPTKEYEDLQKRNTELDERVKKFNAEVKRLDEEEKNIPGVVPQQQEKKKEE